MTTIMMMTTIILAWDQEISTRVLENDRNLLHNVQTIRVKNFQSNNINRKGNLHMYQKHIHKLSLIVAVVVMFVMAISPSFAQTSDSVELVGLIEDMTSTTITVNQQVITLTGAELNIPLEIGTLVKVEGNLSVTGEILAREVNPADDNAQAGEAELVGILESFDGTTMIINGQAIDVSTAEIKEGILVGELVKVHVTATGENMWQAREAEPTIAPSQDDSTDDSTDDNSDNGMQAGEFEIVGTLDEIGDGFVVVSGQTIDVNNAEIKNLLLTGVLVKVHLQNIDGTLVAREIENEIGDNSDDNSNENDNINDNTANDNDNTANTNTNDNTSTDTVVTLEDAANLVLEIYPNTSITEIKLDDDFGNIQIWKVETSHGIEVKIDAQTGVILTIERDGNNNSNINANDNSANTNSNDNVGSNNNSNSDDNNSNNNSNSNDNNDDDDDNSGMGSDDDDDNSGMGSDDDDDDDNSGMGSDDDDD
jgi:hypothetical protein